MIDIHNHILPHTDDGADDMEEAIQMARIAHQDGIRHIIATPHLNDPVLTGAEIEKRTAALNHRLREEAVDVRVYPGAEIPVYLLDNEDYRIGLAGSRYLLVEFPFTGMLPVTSEIFDHLTGLGYRLVIAHPERNLAVMRNPDVLLNMLTSDITLQITAGSLTGEMGRDAMSLARYLMKKGTVTYIASDAHDALDRKPELSPAVKAAGKFLKDRAKSLVEAHPRRILNDD